MRFEFSLQKALEWIAIEEDRKRLEIARLVKRVEELERRRQQALANLAGILEDPVKRLDVGWAPFAADRVPHEAAEADAAERAITEVRGEIARKNGELNRILMRRKGLESLREKRYREHRMREARRDQKRLDEQFGILRLRRQGR